jgi:hypothetical protein
MNARVISCSIIVLIALIPLFTFAQNGSVPADGTAPADQSTGTAPADTGATGGSAPAASAPAASTEPAQVPSAGAATPSASSGAAQAPAPRSTGAPIQAPPPAVANTNPVPEQSAPATASTATPHTIEGDGAYRWAIVAGLVLAIIPFGFLIAAWMRKKQPALTPEQETHNRCFDIENLMKDKLRELTDLKAMAKEKTVEMGKELMRDLVTGTKTGDLLVRIEKAEEQYKKLKKLFEECQIDIDRYAYKGVLIENSLLSTDILKEVRVIRTREAGGWTLHDIRLSKQQIEAIQQNIVDTKWFFHLWEPGKDDVKVVFKDALFDIKHSDRATWQEAIKHGLTRGIPKEQLVFDIVQ